MSFSRLSCAAYLCVSLAFLFQTDRKQMPDSNGIIAGGNVYVNPALGVTISLPGSWHFFDRATNLTGGAKKSEKEMNDGARSNCQGPLCGDAEVDVALQSPPAPPPMYAIFMQAYKLSPEYQDRKRYPLKHFADVMTVGSMGDDWDTEGTLASIQLAGRPAYRLIVHNKRRPTAKGFAYVADSNGRVFLLIATALSEPEKLQSAIENMKLTSGSSK